MNIDQWNESAFLSKVEASANAGLRTVGVILEKDMKNIIGRNHGGVPSRPGNPPNSQTNFLRGQIRFEQKRSLEVRVGSGAFYGIVLEKGATIRAKKKALMIPLSKEMKRRTARGERPANIIISLRFDKTRPLKYIKTKRGVMIVRSVKTVKRSERSVRWGGPMSIGEADEPLFFMTAQVRIAARPWMRPSYERSRKAMMDGFVKTTRQHMGGSR